MKLSLVLCLGFLGCLAMLLATGNKLLRLRVDVGAKAGSDPRLLPRSRGSRSNGENARNVIDVWGFLWHDRINLSYRIVII
jgi:type VI protein secretion system component VasF